LYSFLSFDTRWGWVVNATPQPLYPRERDPVHIVQVAGSAQGPGLDGCGKSGPLTGIGATDRSEAVFRLLCPSPPTVWLRVKLMHTWSMVGSSDSFFEGGNETSVYVKGQELSDRPRTCVAETCFTEFLLPQDMHSPPYTSRMYYVVYWFKFLVCKLFFNMPL
jgi:hypothetical protein